MCVERLTAREQKRCFCSFERSSRCRDEKFKGKVTFSHMTVSSFHLLSSQSLFSSHPPVSFSPLTFSILLSSSSPHLLTSPLIFSSFIFSSFSGELPGFVLHYFLFRLLITGHTKRDIVNCDMKWYGSECAEWECLLKHGQFSSHLVIKGPFTGIRARRICGPF